MNSISVFLGVPPRIPVQAQWETEKGKREGRIEALIAKISQF